MILDDNMLEHMKIVIHALFPAIVTLCLADLNQPAIDCCISMFATSTSAGRDQNHFWIHLRKV